MCRRMWCGVVGWPSLPRGVVVHMHRVMMIVHNVCVWYKRTLLQGEGDEEGGGGPAAQGVRGKAGGCGPQAQVRRRVRPSGILHVSIWFNIPMHITRYGRIYQTPPSIHTAGASGHGVIHVSAVTRPVDATPIGPFTKVQIDVYDTGPYQEVQGHAGLRVRSQQQGGPPAGSGSHVHRQVRLLPFTTLITFSGIVMQSMLPFIHHQLCWGSDEDTRVTTNQLSTLWPSPHHHGRA